MMGSVHSKLHCGVFA